MKPGDLITPGHSFLEGERLFIGMYLGPCRPRPSGEPHVRIVWFATEGMFHEICKMTVALEMRKEFLKVHGE